MKSLVLISFFVSVWGVDGYTEYRNERYRNYYAQPYQYKYAINDPKFKDVKSHWEQNDGQNTKGMYSFLQPDGRKKIVEYLADKNGIAYKVTYEGKAAEGRNYKTDPADDKESHQDVTSNQNNKSFSGDGKYNNHFNKYSPKNEKQSEFRTNDWIGFHGNNRDEKSFTKTNLHEVNYGKDHYDEYDNGSQEESDDGERYDGKSYHDKSYDDLSYKGKSYKDKSNEGNNNEGRSYYGKSYDDKSYDDRSYDDKSYDDKSYDDKSYEDKSYKGKSYDEQGSYAENDDEYNHENSNDEENYDENSYDEKRYYEDAEHTYHEGEYHHGEHHTGTYNHKESHKENSHFNYKPIVHHKPHFRSNDEDYITKPIRKSYSNDESKGRSETSSNYYGNEESNNYYSNLQRYRANRPRGNPHQFQRRSDDFEFDESIQYEKSYNGSENMGNASDIMRDETTEAILESEPDTNSERYFEQNIEEGPKVRNISQSLEKTKYDETISTIFDKLDSKTTDGAESVNIDKRESERNDHIKSEQKYDEEELPRSLGTNLPETINEEFAEDETGPKEELPESQVKDIAELNFKLQIKSSNQPSESQNLSFQNKENMNKDIGTKHIRSSNFNHSKSEDIERNTSINSKYTEPEFKTFSTFKHNFPINKNNNEGNSSKLHNIIKETWKKKIESIKLKFLKFDFAPKNKSMDAGVVKSKLSKDKSIEKIKSKYMKYDKFDKKTENEEGGYIEKDLALKDRNENKVQNLGKNDTTSEKPNELSSYEEYSSAMYNLGQKPAKEKYESNVFEKTDSIHVKYGIQIQHSPSDNQSKNKLLDQESHQVVEPTQENIKETKKYIVYKYNVNNSELDKDGFDKQDNYKNNVKNTSIEQDREYDGNGSNHESYINKTYTPYETEDETIKTDYDKSNDDATEGNYEDKYHSEYDKTNKSKYQNYEYKYKVGHKDELKYDKSHKEKEYYDRYNNKEEVNEDDEQLDNKNATKSDSLEETTHNKYNSSQQVHFYGYNSNKYENNNEHHDKEQDNKQKYTYKHNDTEEEKIYTLTEEPGYYATKYEEKYDAEEQEKYDAKEQEKNDANKQEKYYDEEKQHDRYDTKEKGNYEEYNEQEKYDGYGATKQGINYNSTKEGNDSEDYSDDNYEVIKKYKGESEYDYDEIYVSKGVGNEQRKDSINYGDGKSKVYEENYKDIYTTVTDNSDTKGNGKRIEYSKDNVNYEDDSTSSEKYDDKYKDGVGDYDGKYKDKVEDYDGKYKDGVEDYDGKYNVKQQNKKDKDLAEKDNESTYEDKKEGNNKYKVNQQYSENKYSTQQQNSESKYNMKQQDSRNNSNKNQGSVEYQPSYNNKYNIDSEDGYYPQVGNEDRHEIKQQKYYESDSPIKKGESHFKKNVDEMGNKRKENLSEDEENDQYYPPKNKQKYDRKDEYKSHTNYKTIQYKNAKDYSTNQYENTSDGQIYKEYNNKVKNNVYVVKGKAYAPEYTEGSKGKGQFEKLYIVHPETSNTSDYIEYNYKSNYKEYNENKNETNYEKSYENKYEDDYEKNNKKDDRRYHEKAYGENYAKNNGNYYEKNNGKNYEKNNGKNYENNNDYNYENKNENNYEMNDGYNYENKDGNIYEKNDRNNYENNDEINYEKNIDKIYEKYDVNQEKKEKNIYEKGYGKSYYNNYKDGNHYEKKEENIFEKDYGKSYDNNYKDNNQKSYGTIQKNTGKIKGDNNNSEINSLHKQRYESQNLNNTNNTKFNSDSNENEGIRNSDYSGKLSPALEGRIYNDQERSY